VFRAFAPQMERELVSEGELDRSTERAVMMREEDARELDRVRTEGVAYDMDEWVAGMCAVGAPVFDASGEIRASIALIVPSERFGANERQHHAEATRAAAMALSAKLGYAASTADQADTSA